MCVKMLNPQEHETMIDTAAGSCGFPVHTIFHVWEQIMKDEGLSKSHLFTAEKKPVRCERQIPPAPLCKGGWVSVAATLRKRSNLVAFAKWGVLLSLPLQREI
jgi:hypothetical protein